MTREIKISDGSYVLIDEDDYERVGKWKWSANGNGYAVRNERYAPKKYRKQYLHRFIIGAKKGQIVDHINGNTLDNRKSNLRICDLKGNARNSRGKGGRYSKYKGVTLDKVSRKWVAQIGVDGKNINLGQFETELEAAKTYNEAALKLHGDFAYINDFNEVM